MGLGNCFKGRQFTAEVILWAVRWYLMFPVSYRDLELMLLDRGVEVDHTTIFRWIQAYATELEKRIRPPLRMSNGSWRVDETYICQSASNFAPRMEWAPWAGRLDQQELTIEPGFRRMEAHGQAPHAQHRIQAPSRSGIPGRRDPAWARQAPRHLSKSDPGLGSEVRGRRL